MPLPNPFLPRCTATRGKATGLTTAENITIAPLFLYWKAHPARLGAYGHAAFFVDATRLLVSRMAYRVETTLTPCSAFLSYQHYKRRFCDIGRTWEELLKETGRELEREERQAQARRLLGQQ